MPSNCPSGNFWKIRPGDTFYLIAKNIGTTVEILEQLNPNIDPNKLTVGQEICLPEEPPCPSGIFITVEPGDTFYSIAKEVGTTIDTLLKLNPHLDPENLQIGSNICLP